MVCTCNPITPEARGEDNEFKVILAYLVRPYFVLFLIECRDLVSGFHRENVIKITHQENLQLNETSLALKLIGNKQQRAMPNILQ